MATQQEVAAARQEVCKAAMEFAGDNEHHLGRITLYGRMYEDDPGLVGDYTYAELSEIYDAGMAILT